MLIALIPDHPLRECGNKPYEDIREKKIQMIKMMTHSLKFCDVRKVECRDNNLVFPFEYH